MNAVQLLLTLWPTYQWLLGLMSELTFFNRKFGLSTVPDRFNDDNDIYYNLLTISFIEYFLTLFFMI